MGGSQSTRQLVIEDNTVLMTSDAQRKLLGMPEREMKTNANVSERHLSTPVVSSGTVEDLRQQIEDEYRRKLMEFTEQNHKVKTDEFKKAVEDVEAKFVKHSLPPVCKDLQEQVFNCYNNHLKQPLNCSTQVRVFAEAVEKERRNALLAKQMLH